MLSLVAVLYIRVLSITLVNWKFHMIIVASPGTSHPDVELIREEVRAQYHVMPATRAGFFFVFSLWVI